MTLNEQRTALVGYLHAKVEVCDWHAVSDVANDLRVLEAQMKHVLEDAVRASRDSP